MSRPAIRVESVSKRYRIGAAARPSSLREALTARGRRLLAGVEAGSGGEDREVWALRDVSFDVADGEVLGIIGRNGAGKSTLLKVLSRITEPTRGRAVVRGRVASLLEVGTGFHPELTGRENVYLNGAILGMNRVEIRRKFDAIVAFAGVERFLETPVKHYSSGMYMRLAFAVAAHLEPDVLVVDEVLAVGDAEFQKKCLAKMNEVGASGRAVLFVSHNIAAISALCRRVILLELGRVSVDGPARAVITSYLGALETTRSGPLSTRRDRSGSGVLVFEDIRIRSSVPGGVFRTGEDLEIELAYRSAAPGPCRKVHVAIGVHGPLDEPLFHLATNTSGSDFECVPARGAFVCRVPGVRLAPGRYLLNVFATVNGEVADWVQNAGAIEVEPADVFGSGRLPPPDQGAFVLGHEWDVSEGPPS